MDEAAQAIALSKVLSELLLGAFGMHPLDLERSVAGAATKHLGAREVQLLLVDVDQRRLVPFDPAAPGAFPVDGEGPGRAFRDGVVVEEQATGGRRRLWIPVRDSADRLGVLRIDDDGAVDVATWLPLAALVGELVVTKSMTGDDLVRRRRGEAFSLAAEMRWGLLPPLSFRCDDVVISGILQPSHSIAGDAFDYAVTGSTAWLALVDAMGHGSEAARMANVAVSSIRSSRRGGAGAEEAIVNLDRDIEEQFGDLRYVTAQVATLEIETGALRIANAGHPRPLVLPRGGEPAEIELRAALPAGLRTRPSSTELTLGPGDAVLFYSDGVTDARAPDGATFGADRMVECVTSALHDGVPAAEALRQLALAVDEHRQRTSGDDATVLLVQRTPARAVARRQEPLTSDEAQR